MLKSFIAGKALCIQMLLQIVAVQNIRERGKELKVKALNTIQNNSQQFRSHTGKSFMQVRSNCQHSKLQPSKASNEK